MRLTIHFATLALSLSMLICATTAQTQPKQRILIRDENGKAVPNARVIIDCDGPKREGLSDMAGVFSWTPIPAPTQCAVIVSGTQAEILAELLDIPANGEVNATFVIKHKSGSLEKKGCPPNQLRSDGSCAAPDKPREIDAFDKKGCPEPLLMRYGFCVTRDRAREIDKLDFGRDCPKPALLRYGNCVTANEARALDIEGATADCKRRGSGWNWRGGSPNNPVGYCVPDSEIAAAEAADDAECARSLAGSRAGWVAESTWGCRCPSGYVPDNARRKCVVAETSTQPSVGSFTADGAIWRIVDGYPKPDEFFQNRIKADPRNRSSADGFTIVGERNMVSTFSISEMPDALEVGKTYQLTLTGISVTPDDQPDCSGSAMIYVLDAPTKSIHDGKLVGSKRGNSSYYVTPPCKYPPWVNNNKSGPQNWANNDQVTFVFRPAGGAESFRVAIVPVFGYREIAIEFMYRPFRPAPPK